MAAILIIDLSPTIRETLRIVLGGEHTVTVAPSWSDVVPTTPPDLVIFGAPPPPRDDAADGAARARIAPDAPLLLLNPAHELDLRALAPPGHRIELLPKPFDANMLRSRIRQLLTPVPRRLPTEATAARHRRWLEPPFVTPAAAALVRRATMTDLPVLLVGERGTGTIDVARAIHFFAGGGDLVARSARDVGTRLLPRTDAGEAPDAVVIVDVHRLAADAQHALLEHLRDRGNAEPAVRVFATTDADLETYAGDAFAPELVYALGAVPIFLAPLRERVADVPMLVDALVPALAARARLEAVTVTVAALARLQRYLWFGNVAELEAVLARTLARHRPRVIEPEMLVFTADGGRASLEDTSASADPRPIAPATTKPTATTLPPAIGLAPPPTASRGRVLPLERRRNEELADAENADGSGTRPPLLPASLRPVADPESDGAATSAGPSLEVLLGELAHELRNPMVTIKTFAQHLDSVLDDAEARARFASLTGEAITRMDTLLETLLDFARFRAPLPQSVDLAALLARALDERADELARKGVRVERDASTCVVEADGAQVLFAFRSLVDGLVRDLVPHAPLRITARADGALELTVQADRAITARLAAYVGDEGHAAEAATPLAFALASALIRRNRGRLEARAGDDRATIITVTIPRTVAHGER